MRLGEQPLQDSVRQLVQGVLHDGGTDELCSYLQTLDRGQTSSLAEKINALKVVVERSNAQEGDEEDWSSGVDPENS